MHGLMKGALIVYFILSLGNFTIGYQALLYVASRVHFSYLSSCVIGTKKEKPRPP
jgi:hypothetical protein